MRKVYLDLENTLSTASDRQLGVHMTPGHVLLLNELLPIRRLKLILVGKEAQKISTPTWALNKLGNKLSIRTKRVLLKVYGPYIHGVGYSPKAFKTYGEAVTYDAQQYSKKPKWVYLSADAAQFAKPNPNWIWVDPTYGLTPKIMEQVKHALA